MALRRALAARGATTDDLGNAIEEKLACRLLADYGALFVANPRSVLTPPALMFRDEDEVKNFQERAGWSAADIDGAVIELQPAAMRSLLAARSAAQRGGSNITPRGGSEAARRTYADTLRLWESRFLPALTHWAACGRLADDDVRRMMTLDASAQAAAALALEERGLYFSKDFSKSVFYSVAPPGASQHLSMLAFDATEFQNANVRRTLAAHGWFQTVRSDLPHFTFLGLAENELPAHGLRAHMEANGQVFWIPNIETNDDLAADVDGGGERRSLTNDLDR